MKRFHVFALFCLLAGNSLAGTLKGILVDQTKHPVHQATVAVIELRRKTTVGQDGVFTFNDVQEGTYNLMVTSQEFGSRQYQVEVKEGEVKTHTLLIDMVIHDEIVVSATASKKSISDVSQAVGVLNNENLILRMAPSLGETLANQPGVTSTYAGPATSRPMIRGLGGDRVAVLEGGLASGDVSSLSGDHAVAIDPTGAERIEILRGPVSLRYGSSAVGGAINVVDNRIPELLSNEAIAGSIDLRGNSVNEERGASSSLGGGIGRFAWHADLSTVEAEDTDVPGIADLEEVEEGEEHAGTLENSGFDNQKGSFGGSYIAQRGFIGVAFTQLDSLYGVPGHEEHAHEGEKREEEDEFVRIDLNQKRFEARGEYALGSDTFKSINFRLSDANYEHTELEGEEIGTVFRNDQVDFRMEVVNQKLGPFGEGSFGFQAGNRDFAAIGEEAFVPPNETKKVAAFAYQERAIGKLRWVIGARFEHQGNDAQALEHDHEDGETGDHAAEEGQQRDFDSGSASTGFVWKLNSSYIIASNLTHTERAPTAEELFSNGPHLATGAYEVGNPDLSPEKSFGIDVSLRKQQGSVTGEVNLFRNAFTDFVYEAFSGNEVDGLDEYLFRQNDADLTGAEAHVDVSLLHQDPHHLHLDLSYDVVRGEFNEGGNLPRITPSRFGARLEYQATHIHAGLEARLTNDQNRVSLRETPTEGYTLVNADLGYHFLLGTSLHKISLRGTNLTDEEGRVHTSFFKDKTLLPGRNFGLSYRVSF